MSFSLNGVRVPHRKHTASCSATPITDIQTVTIPMSMHIGAPAKPCVKAGDLVSVGTLIAEAGGFVSAPIHASVSGKVTKIADCLLSSGQTAPAVVIESDGLMTPDPALAPPTVDSRESLLEAIKADCQLGALYMPDYSDPVLNSVWIISDDVYHYLNADSDCVNINAWIKDHT